MIVNFENFLKPTVIQGLSHKKFISFKFRLCLVIICKLFLNFWTIILKDYYYGAAAQAGAAGPRRLRTGGRRGSGRGRGRGSGRRRRFGRLNVRRRRKNRG